MPYCEMCFKHLKQEEMFIDRCGDCQKIGFAIWGFGETAEAQRKKLNLKAQRRMVVAKKKETKP